MSYYNRNTSLLFGHIFASNCLIFGLIVCAALNVFAAPATSDKTNKTADQQQQQQQPESKIYFKLDWIGKPEVNSGFGETKLITACTNTGDTPSQSSASSLFSHHLAFSGDSDELRSDEHIHVRDDELKELLVQNSTIEALVSKLGPGTNLTIAPNQRSTVSTQVWLDKRSRSVVNFRDQQIKLSGRVRRTINLEKHALEHAQEQRRLLQVCLQKSRSRLGPIVKNDCHLNDNKFKLPEQISRDRVEEFELVVQSTQVDSNGVAVGDFSVDYFGSEMYKHPAFYNLQDKSIQLDAKTKANQKLSMVEVRSPFACAEFALAMDKQIALYDIAKQRCQLHDLAEVEAKSIAQRRDLLNSTKSASEYLFDRAGSPLGEYKMSKWPTLAHKMTNDQSIVKHWLPEKECDLISAMKNKYMCFKFPTQQATVLMFKRQVVNMWV